MTEQCGTNTYEHQHRACSCGCGCGCGCGCNTHHHNDMEGNCHCAEKLLDIADEAWREVLKEKIKAKIVAKKGEHIEKLAEIIAIANGEKWKHKISAKTKYNEFKDGLKEFLSSSD